MSGMIPEIKLLCPRNTEYLEPDGSKRRFEVFFALQSLLGRSGCNGLPQIWLTIELTWQVQMELVFQCKLQKPSRWLNTNKLSTMPCNWFGYVLEPQVSSKKSLDHWKGFLTVEWSEIIPDTLDLNITTCTQSQIFNESNSKVAEMTFHSKSFHKVVSQYQDARNGRKRHLHPPER